MFPFLSRQIVQLTKDEFVALLNSQSLSVHSFSSKTKQALSKVGELTTNISCLELSYMNEPNSSVYFLETFV